MGNSALSCCRGRGKVRVVLTNGDVAEFKEPVKAATVMKKFPQHMVLHCCMASSHGMEQRRKVCVLRPDQYLKRKENYLITSTRATGNAKAFLDSWAFFALNTCNKKLNAEARQKSSKNTTSWMQAVFDKICRSSRSNVISDDNSTRPLLGFNRPVPRPVVESRKSGDGLTDWKPCLACIPESPNRSAHSSAPLSRSSSYSSFRLLDFS
jgi:hypothetical protein